MKQKKSASTDAVFGKKTGLLIVEDSDVIRERLVDMFAELENIGPVMESKDSTEAMHLFNTFLPGIVILDIRIQGENGIMVLEKFKKLRPETVIIMLTNYPVEPYRNLCLELGADYFFEKTEDMNKITRLCRDLTGGRINPGIELNNLV